MLQLEADDTEFQVTDTATFTVDPVNQPPVVTADDGVGLTPVSTTVPLTGTVTDDGIALPLTLTWSQISGPGTATITDPSAEDTTVSFDVAGAYVLQLEADDTEFQVTDTATFTVTVNQPPVVTVDDGSAVLFTATPIVATVTDDGVALPLTFTWSQISGPGIATFSDPSSLDATVSFDTIGTYVIQLEADDTEFQVTDTATFIVIDGEPAILVVDEATNPTVADTRIAAQLEVLGFAPAFITDDDAVASDADGMSLVVISETVRSATISGTFASVTVPVVLAEGFIYDDMGLTGNSVGTDLDVVLDETMVTITGSTPLTQGLSGDITLTNSADQNIVWGVPAPSAIIGAHQFGDPTHPVLFAYDTGDAMVTGTAPARRVVVPYGDNSPLAWTADLQQLFVRGVEWGRRPRAGGSGAHPVAGAIRSPRASMASRVIAIRST